MTTVTKNEGFDGLIRILNAKEIDPESWLVRPIVKERGGFEMVLPNASGEIYLGWEDLFKIDITMTQTQKKFESTLSLADTKEVIQMLEDHRVRHVGQIRDFLKKAFEKKSNIEKRNSHPYDDSGYPMLRTERRLRAEREEE